MRLGQIRGKPVVSVAEAIKLGAVGDALTDQTLGSVSALEIVADRRSDRYVVPMGEVIAIGPDVVTVSGQHALRSPSLAGEADSRQSLNSIVGSRVVAEHGSVLGTVTEVHIDQRTGRIEAIEYGGDGLESLLGGRHQIKPERVIGVGPRVMTVRDESSRAAEEQERAA
jgi:uncharacterized protein YrrD